MSVDPTQDKVSDILTLQDALNTAAELAATGIDDSVARVSPTIISATLKSVSTAPITKSLVAKTPSAPNTKTLPFIVPNPTPSQQSLHTYVSYISPQPVPHQPQLPHLIPIMLHTSTSQFDQMALRRGKWTVEEEAYADFLIHEFEQGTVEGCENGCTLRSFLSKKLHCAPMRISKKYAGKSIGKLVFLSKASTSVNPAISQSDLKSKGAKLKELEANFYKSLCREAEPNEPYCASFATGDMIVPTSYFVPGTPASFLSYGQSYGHQANHLHQPFIPSIQQHSLQSVNLTAQVLSNSSSISPPKAFCLPQIAPVAPVQAVCLRQTMQTTTQNAPQEIAPRPAPAIAQSNDCKELPKQFSSKIEPAPNKESMDLPDFLSGFDKVALISKANSANSEISKDPHCPKEGAILENSQYSPPFTSRSFDDLHQLLGKGLSPRPLDSACTEFHELDINDENLENISGAPDLSVTVDSYVKFAQESARAVSQHSAYFQNGTQSLDSSRVESSIEREGKMFTTATINAENLKAYLCSDSNNKFDFGFPFSAWQGKKHPIETVSLISGSISDNSSETRSNDQDSDSNSDERPQQKKFKVDSLTMG